MWPINLQTLTTPKCFSFSKHFTILSLLSAFFRTKHVELKMVEKKYQDDSYLMLMSVQVCGLFYLNTFSLTSVRSNVEHL